MLGGPTVWIRPLEFDDHIGYFELWPFELESWSALRTSLLGRQRAYGLDVQRRKRFRDGEGLRYGLGSYRRSLGWPHSVFTGCLASRNYQAVE